MGMSPDVHSFIHLLFIGTIALFPVVNPIGSAFIVLPYFNNLTEKQKHQAVRKISFYAFMICVVALFTGHWILQIFGLSIPVVQVAGGAVVCALAWNVLADNSKPVDVTIDPAHAKLIRQILRQQTKATQAAMIRYRINFSTRSHFPSQLVRGRSQCFLR